MSRPTDPDDSSKPASSMRTSGRNRSRIRRLPPVTVVPTLCTLGNLIAGFAALNYAMKDPNITVAFGLRPLEFAAILIFVGMLLDAIDGSLARLVNGESDLGAQIDSLADMVTFGVAPAFLTLRLVSLVLEEGFIIGPEADNILGKIVWAAAAVYVSCAALRLARFNLEATANIKVGDVDADSNTQASKQFHGLPSPGAAGTIAGLIALHQNLLMTRFAEDVPQAFVRGAALGIPLVMLVCGLLMVSSIPYVHATNRFVRGQHSFTYVVRFVLLLVLLIGWLEETLAILFTAYAFSGPVRLLILKIRNRGKPNAD
ncbi:MAG: CDP-alcohol phosphatidyltransferase family protein [Planctomycetes bacterium]|nr:CDP-alcohol phosphatidyltransferase family protein [Planctomycetota bacterium]